MKIKLIGVIAALGLAFATSTFAAPLKLTPANPQPTGLKPGLSVSYGYASDGQHIKTLADAAAALNQRAERGQPLKGLDYRDTNPGERTLTSKRAENVAASIQGYIRFDAPGIYNIDFLTNDGLNAKIGGQRVGYYDGRQTCDTTVATQVQVPVAGWYKLEALYFQRLQTACLHMRWGPQGSKIKWVPNSAFAYR
ncbi:MAG: hypothetical protein ACI8R4_000024 [Paracoccaceae bacterium]|jgi:hypothetical protein